MSNGNMKETPPAHKHIGLYETPSEQIHDLIWHMVKFGTYIDLFLFIHLLSFNTLVVSFYCNIEHSNKT